MRSGFRAPGARVAALALSLALWAPGCSGGAREGAPQEAPRPAAQQTEQRDRAREAALARHRARQEAACRDVGEVLFACAVEDARAKLNPEELAELDGEGLKDAYMQDFLGKCLGSDMSPRQVGVYEHCVAEDTRCEALVPCLDQARPRPAAAP